MDRTLARFALASGLSFAAASAHAGALVQAELFAQIGVLPPASFTSSGLLAGSASGTGAGASWTVGAGAVPSGTSTGMVTTPPVENIIYILNGNPVGGIFAASSPGDMSVTGFADITAYGGLTLLGIPLVLGVPTTVLAPVVTGVGITAHGNAWTTKTTTVTLTSLAGTGAVTAMGANGLVNGGGTVVLVTAVNVLTNVAGQIPSFAVLTLTFEPDAVAEPALPVLLVAGAAGVAGLRRRVASQREPQAGGPTAP